MKKNLIGLVLSATHGITAILHFDNKSKSENTLNLAYNGGQMSGLDGTHSRVLSDFFKAQQIKATIKNGSDSLFNGQAIVVNSADGEKTLSGVVVSVEGIPEFTVAKGSRHHSNDKSGVMTVSDASAILVIDPANQPFGGVDSFKHELNLFSEFDTSVVFENGSDAAQALRAAANDLLRQADQVEKGFNEMGFEDGVKLSLGRSEDYLFAGTFSARGAVKRADSDYVISMINRHLHDYLTKLQKRNQLTARQAELQAELERNQTELGKLA